MLLFCLFLLADGSTSVAATVNGESISLEAVDRSIRLSAVGPAKANTSLQRSLRRAALDDLIDDLLLRQFLAKQKIVVPPKEIDEHIGVLTDALKKRNSSYDAYLKESGLTNDQAREQFALLIGFEKFAKKTGTAEELQKFHVLHRDYFDRVKVRVDVRIVRIPNDASSSEKANALVRLRSGRGEPFHPDAKTTEIGWIPKFDSPIGDALASLAFSLKPGQTSAPVEVPFGMAIVTCMERSEPKPLPYAEIEEWVRDTYANQLRAL